ncbi:hypothetical protein L9Z41_16925 [Leptospira noguchii]|uniref:DUF4376 domain-containing protein n=1 Tax=Leptospira noguchii TaxID=28182 RepID=UPI001F0571DE|nr:hypothetical protein [Leptospira noguchii]MCH1910637.1 hypothetical protein [Leptospira noguchii]MCH1911745.1 hypothetical protein [Leptospira noguchii]MCH1911792.1 hypothetical protein [Leptospira noguchii]MCH1913104.1 hypothetical protein [Leptospira noguchii]MCH1913773.1 hypothetical protein [Leptospira noguchii]
MNYILDKTNKRVVWINADSNQMTGIDAWANFKPDRHEIVYSLHYNPEIGETFLAEIKDGIAQDFEPSKVYNKISKEERILQSWEDKIDLETETEDEPRRDGSGSVLPHQVYTESGGWIIDIDQKRDSLIRLVNSICESKITAGFVSSALGAPHFYNSDRDDQLNLVGLVSLNTSVLHECTDEDEIKEERKHTFDQIKQVLGDGVARKTFLLQRCASLKAMIQFANTIEKFDQIDINSGWE